MMSDYDAVELADSMLQLIKKVCRGLRVLEHVTAFNEGNQKHVLNHKSEQPLPAKLYSFSLL